LQLHGDESVEYCAHLRKTVPQLSLIKAIAIRPGFEFESLSNYPVDSIMIDAFDPHLRGGTGRTADWATARAAAEIFPAIILAGGLSSKNVAEAIAKVRPEAVDACSSLETSPGRKNAERMNEFVNAVRASKLPAEPAGSAAREGN